MSDLPAPLRVLLVAYAFPPVGGVGVQRAAKLCKYLPEHGVEPVVLTVANPSVPLRDERLEQELPASLSVHRTRTLEPGYGAKQATWNRAARPGARQRISLSGLLGTLAKNLLLPDPQLLWLPTAAFTAARLTVLHRSVDVVLITAPPFSQFLLMPILQGLANVPIVLDYRDEWLTLRQSYEMLGSALGKRVGDMLEQWLVQRATRITCATPEFRDNLLQRYPSLAPARVVTIPNGYDPDDLPVSLPQPPTDRFVIAYAGTIYKLNSVQGLLSAVRLLWQQAPELAQYLELRFYGRIVETEARHFEDTERFGVRRFGFVPRDQVLSRLLEGHLVLCTLDETPGAASIYPAKIFEMMMLKRRVLALAPEGALSRLVREQHLGDVLPPRDTRQIAEYLERALRQFVAGQTAPRPPDQHAEVGGYHRREIAGRFAALLREVVAESISPSAHRT